MGLAGCFGDDGWILALGSAFERVAEAEQSRGGHSAHGGAAESVDRPFDRVALGVVSFWLVVGHQVTIPSRRRPANRAGPTLRRPRPLSTLRARAPLDVSWFVVVCGSRMRRRPRRSMITTVIARLSRSDPLLSIVQTQLWKLAAVLSDAADAGSAPGLRVSCECRGTFRNLPRERGRSSNALIRGAGGC
jgi:hypothetical protein